MQYHLIKFKAALIKLKREIAFVISPELKAECEYRNIKKAFESGFKAARKHQLDNNSSVHFKQYLIESANAINKQIDTNAVRY